MINKEKHIPVVELPHFDEADDDAAITWDFTLPPSLDDPERIVVDTENLRRIQRTASFRASHVFEYHGDKSEVTPSVSGASSDGTATAGLAAHITLAETQKTRQLDDMPDDPQLMMDYLKTRTITKLNKNEISSQVVDLRESRNISREQAWARVVNKAIAQSLRESSYDHLMGRTPYSLKGIYAGYHVANVSTALMIDGSLSYWGCAVGAGLTVGVGTWRNRQLYSDSLIRERRWSAVAWAGGIQPEKWLATDTLTRVLPVVRYRK